MSSAVLHVIENTSFQDFESYSTHHYFISVGYEPCDPVPHGLSTMPTSTQMTEASFPAVSVASSQRTATEVEQELAAPKTESVSQRGGRPSEEEQGHSLGIGLA